MADEPARVRALLTIELSLERKLTAEWMREVGQPVIAEIREHIANDRFDLADKAVDKITFTGLRTQQGAAEIAAEAAFTLGASHFAGSPADTEQARGAELPESVANAVEQLFNGLDVAGKDIQDRTRAVIREAEEQLAEDFIPNPFGFIAKVEIHKAVIAGLAKQLNRAVASGGRVTMGAGANLATTRLASLGSVSQALASGHSTYQVTEVLDSATCPVCRRFHGSIFNADQALAQLSGQLSVADPMELKASNPFPNQSRAGIDQLTSMSNEERVARGWSFPPFHPWCRGQLVPVGTVGAASISGFVPRGTFAGESSAAPTAPRAAQGRGRQVATEPEPVRGPNLEAKTSMKKWTDDEGLFLPEQLAVHDEIVAATIRSAVKPQLGDRTFHMMGGGPASGKGRVISLLEEGLEDVSGKLVKSPPNAVLVDVDKVKAALPDFRDLQAAGSRNAANFVHDESSLVGKRILQQSAKEDLNTILDGTGDGKFESLTKKVNQFKDKGYKVNADYVTLETDEAVRRSMKRAIENPDRSMVPETIIRKTHRDVSKVVPQALDEGLYDTMRVWDNNVPKGSDPILIFELREGGERVVHNQALWDDFLRKADEDITRVTFPEMLEEIT